MNTKLNLYAVRFIRGLLLLGIWCGIVYYIVFQIPKGMGPVEKRILGPVSTLLALGGDVNELRAYVWLIIGGLASWFVKWRLPDPKDPAEELLTSEKTASQNKDWGDARFIVLYLLLPILGIAYLVQFLE